jgi:UDP-N-acetylmuramate dehydrogenase
MMVDQQEFDRVLLTLSPSIAIQKNVSLSRMNTWRTGGSAWAVAEPKTEHELQEVLELVRAHRIPLAILGWGSNVWIPDAGIPGLVIRTKSFEVETHWVGNQVIAGAGVGATRLIRESADRDLSGLERIVGVPGSMGGMVMMNAGTHLGEVGELVREVEALLLLEDQVEKRVYKPKIQDWHYRGNSFLPSNAIVVRAKLDLHPGDPEQLRALLKDLLERRKKSQPIDAPSCGSTYRNPDGIGKKAWQVIDAAGLRGHKIGGAQVSEKHSNFLINTGNATSDDLLLLMRHIEETVQKTQGIVLQREVKPLAIFWPDSTASQSAW